jgi:lambda repressor-like predicted transcriptional regulator
MDNNPTTRIISQRVSASYRASGASLNGLATKAGIPRSTLRRKLDGHAEFKISELLCIAPILNADVTEWLDGIAQAAA